ncbi:hypothetical protein [Lentzea flava]|uniref:DoxX protein n=1 Tax=Lentzea flava TaxID=103732 RepID=A0ABQ2UDB7_9PSEU|nr:hypothetical protein [Lentzea flava]MCP2196354.1 hypothetical protein [Lentzea flava]GGU18446.1 hypothetical protein GCM10010178_08210 [Lentzea flava]
MISRSLLRQLPARVAAGAFVLHSGLGKRNADEETAGQLHGWASSTYPVLGKLDARRFTRLLAAGEMATGAALLMPFVPAVVAGAALTGFAGALLGLYAKTPGMRREGSIWPTEQGIGLAKDVWMLGIGLSLVVDGVTRD